MIPPPFYELKTFQYTENVEFLKSTNLQNILILLFRTYTSWARRWQSTCRGTGSRSGIRAPTVVIMWSSSIVRTSPWRASTGNTGSSTSIRCRIWKIKIPTWRITFSNLVASRLEQRFKLHISWNSVLTFIFWSLLQIIEFFDKTFE